VAVTADSAPPAAADVVVLAVKPQVLPSVLSELKGRLRPSQTVLSVAAGVPLARLREGLAHRAVARAMPNMPAQVGAGMIVWTAPAGAPEQLREAATQVLSTLGRALYVPDEKYIDMATAVSGSGPAYVFMFLEALADAAVHIGLPAEMARELATQTVLGSARLAEQTGCHPAELRNLVTSPGGTTAEALLKLEESGLRGAIGRAVQAAFERAKTLGK
jgi:pyrroline-5-carboxylate reductase